MTKKLLSTLFAARAAGKAIKGNPLQYDWRVDGLPAAFGVDMRLAELAPMPSHPVLACIGFLSRSEYRSKHGKMRAFERPCALQAAALKKALSFIKRCTADMNAIIAGYVETDAELQYYLYLPSCAECERMKALAAKKKAFECRIVGHAEPDWKSYFDVLIPDEAKAATIHNAELLSTLYKNGDSDAPRRINLHLAFPTAVQREAFASDALAEGFATGDLLDGSIAHEDCPFEISVHRICALKKWDIDTITIHALRLAKNCGGKFVYWDCPIVPRKL